MKGIIEYKTNFLMNGFLTFCEKYNASNVYSITS